MPLPYRQPNFVTLYKQSQSLRETFYKSANLFYLFTKKPRDKKELDESMGWPELREEVLSLSTKYTVAEAEISQLQGYFASACRFFGKGLASVGLSPTDRAGQIASLSSLIPLLKEDEPQTTVASAAKEADPEKEAKEAKDDKKRIYILLGALFYRLLRIAQDYSSLDEAILQSALCRAIYSQILGLSAKNKLDHWTVMIACQFFYNCIETNNTGARVAYIKEDEKFFEKLKKIIEDATGRAKPIINQLSYIDFVQSVAKTLAKFNNKLLPLLDEILEGKIKPAPNSSSAILTYLDQKEGLSPDYHAYLKLVVANDNTEFSTDARPNAPKSLEQAIEQIKIRVALRNEYTLVGAYLAVLMRCTEGSWPNKKIKTAKYAP